ncbi:MAG: hypothetical protein J0M29_14795 [Chitinophagales bacterium]|nr:hypothetical protein [Chitinophagales bacterium]
MPPLEVRMEVVFGTPSQNCIGSGVCMVMHHLPQRYPLYCPHAPALISFQGGQILFRFLKTEMQRADACHRFEGPWFVVEEEFRMPKSTARRLGMPTEWIQPGVYAIEETAREWQIRFKVFDQHAFGRSRH